MVMSHKWAIERPHFFDVLFPLGKTPFYFIKWPRVLFSTIITVCILQKLMISMEFKMQLLFDNKANNLFNFVEMIDFREMDYLSW